MKSSNEQSGNVLFLILIAVALFAALSYAVTQSSRGGGDTNKETRAIELARVTQQLMSIKSTALRMVISGTDPANIDLAEDPDLGAPCTSVTDCVFTSNGGSAVHIPPPPELGANSFFRFEYLEVSEGNNLPGTGTTAADVFVHLPDVTLEACEEFNEKMGITNPPAIDATGFNSSFDAYPGEEIACYESQFGNYNIYAAVYIR
jgi:hypothetical protein